MSNAVLIPSSKGFVTREEVMRQTAPERTRTWNPIPHRRLLGWVEDSLDNHGWTIDRDKEQHTLNHDGETWFAVFPIHCNLADGVQLACGVRNDTGKRLSGSFLAGRRVMICANLDFSSELMAMSKHSNRITDRLPQAIDRVAGRLVDYCEKETSAIHAMRSKHLTEANSDHQLVRMVVNEVIPQTELMKVRKVYQADQRWGPEPTVWRLHNAATWILQRRLATNAPDFAVRTMRLNRQMERLALN